MCILYHPILSRSISTKQQKKHKTTQNNKQISSNFMVSLTCPSLWGKESKCGLGGEMPQWQSRIHRPQRCQSSFGEVAWRCLETRDVHSCSRFSIMFHSQSTRAVAWMTFFLPATPQAFEPRLRQSADLKCAPEARGAGGSQWSEADLKASGAW